MQAECVVKIAIFLPFELVECMLNKIRIIDWISQLFSRRVGAHPMYVYYNSSTERAIIRQKVQFRDAKLLALGKSYKYPHSKFISLFLSIFSLTMCSFLEIDLISVCEGGQIEDVVGKNFKV